MGIWCGPAAGIRILSKKYSRENLINNPKRTEQTPNNTQGQVLDLGDGLEVIVK